jgi:hypothetical protein
VDYLANDASWSNQRKARDHDFGQDLGTVNAEFPSVWEQLSRGGVRVGLFGSLQSYPLPRISRTMPSMSQIPLQLAQKPFPNIWRPSRISTFRWWTVQGAMSPVACLRDAAKFLAAAPGLGLRGKAVAKLVGQVASERLKPNRVVRRRTSQMQIAFDFFLKELKRTEPEAAFFFTNHVASAMHHYWPATFPQDYANDVWTPNWKAEFGDEIAFAMRELDVQLAEVVALVDRDPRYTLGGGLQHGTGRGGKQSRPHATPDVRYRPVHAGHRRSGIELAATARHGPPLYDRRSQ